MFLLGSLVSFGYLTASAFALVSLFSGEQGGRLPSKRLSAIAALVSIPLHFALLLALGIKERAMPLGSFFQALSVLSFFLMLIYLLLRISKVKSIGIFVFPFVFTLHAIGTFGPRLIGLSESIAKPPLFWFHTVLMLLGYASFGYAMILGIMYLYLFREIKYNRPNRMYDRLPPLELLDRLNIIALAGGFAFLSVGMVLGAGLAKSLWNEIPFWDPKIIVTLILWLAYLIALTLHSIRNWSGRKMSVASIGRFAAVVAGVVIARLFETSFHKF